MSRTGTGAAARTNWTDVLGVAREIVDSYDTPVTLRQLFYRLVARGLIRNTRPQYQWLSVMTAQGRRDGTFPALIDEGRDIENVWYYASPGEALTGLALSYREDRTAGQPYTLYLGNEKQGQVAQLRLWFGDLGIPILPFGGYSSQTFEHDVVKHSLQYDREPKLLYAGDWDATGHHILTNFVKQTGIFGCDADDDDEDVEAVADECRIALNVDQVEEYDLPVLAGKPGDPRAIKWVEEHGTILDDQRRPCPKQVELDALDPDVLREVYQTAIDQYWDQDAYDEALAVEAEHRQRLMDVAREFN